MLLKLLITLTLPVLSVSLQCWNCVGQDCDYYRSNSKNWELVTCPEGSVCQKTDFSFYSNQKNQSISTYTVRSCSYETGCTWDRSKTCQRSPVQYAGKGCADRYCCGKDKCNEAMRFESFLTGALLMVIGF